MTSFVLLSTPAQAIVVSPQSSAQHFPSKILELKKGLYLVSWYANIAKLLSPFSSIHDLHYFLRNLDEMINKKIITQGNTDIIYRYATISSSLIGHKKASFFVIRFRRDIN